MRAFFRLLNVAAVLMLVIAGGTYTHANEVPHSHEVSGEIASSAEAQHRHLGSEHGRNSGGQELLHCGSSLLALTSEANFDIYLTGRQYIRFQTVDFEHLLIGCDPPPPRQIS